MPGELLMFKITIGNNIMFDNIVNVIIIMIAIIIISDKFSVTVRIK